MSATSAPVRIPHLTGWAALGTWAAGATLLLVAARVLLRAAAGAEGWVFLGFAGVTCGLAGGALLLLPSRLTTTIDDKGVSLGWAFGRLRIDWTEIERVVIGPLGSGGERDPIAVVLHLGTGDEVLYALLGRQTPTEHRSAGPLLEAARRAGVPVDDVTAPPAERAARAESWRRARLKGWR